MTNKEKQDWLKDNYPLTIITDRYSGTYSDGYYLAFPLDFDEIPSAVNDSDPECAEFWKDYLEPVGKGSSVQAAIDDLIYKMRSNVIIDVPFGAQDSELKGWEYTIPEGMEAELKDGKIIVRQKESEDEGIIRAIIDALYSHTNSINLLSSRGYQMENIEAWLEKQKEQKPVEKAAFTPVDTELTKFEKAVVKLCQIGKDEYPCYEFAKKYAPSLLDLAKKEFEKPAEWSEEDERMLSRCIKSIETSKQFADSDTFKAAKDKEIAWLKSLSLNLKKKNEDVAKLCSNEWSEEDEHRRKDAIYFLESAKKHYADTSEIEKTIDWLKSLRPQPHWKPSEEQMGALAKAVTFFKTKWTGAKVKEQLALESLYEDLKKL